MPTPGQLPASRSPSSDGDFHLRRIRILRVARAVGCDIKAFHTGQIMRLLANTNRSFAALSGPREKLSLGLTLLLIALLLVSGASG